MPGITGICSARAGDWLPALTRELFPARPGMRRVAGGGESFACVVWSRHEESGVLERAGTVLAFEGWLFAGPPAGRPFLSWLLDRFEESGPAFVETLSGSFQLAVHRRGTTWLATDPTGSRRLFFTAGDGELAFAPEVGPLAPLSGGGWEPANLVQFLVSGRFFAGETLLPRVLQILPGEIVTHRRVHESRIERRRYFEFTLSETSKDSEVGEADFLEAFRATLDRAVARHLARARRPVFLLSGGYDSRYLYQAAARLAADPSRLFSALWGERMDEPGSDNWTARSVAGRFGARHLTLPWRAAALPGQFEAMFRAHSGMTEMAFTHADELAVFAALAEEGALWAIRGDECFGPKGAGARDADEALAQAGMGRIDRVSGAEEWFSGHGEELRAAHRRALADRLAGAPAAPDDLRDTLYGRERLPAFLQHHNYHKLHFLEMSNPFLDPEVLRFWSTLPARHRTGKALFCRAYHQAFGDVADPPIATLGNGIDWPAALRRDPALTAWVRAGLAELPAPLSRDFFVGRLDAVLAGREAPGIAPVKLVARAFVLGHWLHTWARG